jgi:hypothetical protein
VVARRMLCEYGHLVANRFVVQVAVGQTGTATM